MEFRILGPLEVLDEGASIRVVGARQRAVLALLLIRANEVVSSDRLIDELWGETPPEGAANALQAAVSRLRHALRPSRRQDGNSAALLTRTPGYVLQVDPEAIDARCFERLAAEGRAELAAGDPARAAGLLGRALELWRGPALSGFDYETFAQAEIDRLEELRRAALEERVAADLALGRHEEVLGELRTLVSSYPLSERLRGHLMLALFRSGRRTEALQAYAECRKMLTDELGVEPDPELRDLQEAIARGDPALLAAPSPPAGEPGPTNVGAELTSFVGRGHEAEEITRLLAEHRLVTLTGPGGAGKTRLAGHLAAGLVGSFRDGVWQVDLTSVPSERFLVHAIAATLHFPIDQFVSDVDARGQLLDYLRRREMLIVLDNFEHLIGTAELAVEILAAAPGVKLLVTSRERLGVSEESVFDLAGLSHLPPDRGSDEPDALRLFLDRARQVDPRLAVGGVDRIAALRICALVEGMPLGLELAAAWASVLSCSEIAAEIEHSVDFLTTTMQDVPAGHRSMRAAFQHSWKLLSDPERAGLRKLSVFRAGFSREAAQEIAGVDLRVLTGLVGKSVVRRGPDGRYGMHELIRQYAGEEFAADPEELAATTRRHADYYLGLLIERRESFVSGKALQARDEMRPNIADLRDAMLYAVTAWDDERALEAVRSLLNFYRAHGMHEGIAALREIADFLRERGASIEVASPARRILMATIAAQALCETVCGNVTAAETLRACLPHLRLERGMRRELGTDLVALGTDIDFLGDARQAVGLLEEARGILRDVGDGSLVWPCLLWLGWAHLELGHYPRGTAAFQEAHEISARSGDPFGLAYSLSKLGVAADVRGAYAEGRRYHTAALEGFTRLGDRAGLAYTLSRMSVGAWGMGNHAEAERLGREGLELFVAIGHRWGTAAAYCRIGFAQIGQGKLAEARESLRMALRLALDHCLGATVLYGLIGVAGVLVREGEVDRGAEMLRYVLRHPDLTAFYRPYARSELALAEARAAVRPAAARGKRRYLRSRDLVEVATQVLDELQPSDRMGRARHGKIAGEGVAAPA
jgi:predicted ATPase/DNA-binding SARP family transcriptional activator